MCNDRGNEHSNLVGQSEGNGPLVECRRRRDDDIKTNLREVRVSRCGLD